jgi:PhnO protein
MKENWKIREVEVKDLLEVKLLLDELENRVSDLAIFTEIFHHYCTEISTLFYVAELKNNGIIGFITCKSQWLLHHEGQVCEIQEMIVTKDFQGKGIGKELVEKVKKVVLAWGVKSLEVSSNKRRKEAHQFYQKIGFKNSHEKFTIYFD